MLSSGKLTLTSKKPRQCLKITPRKPVKGCYCNLDISKTHTKSPQIQRKSVSHSCHCRGELDYKFVEKIDDEAIVTSPISCEIFRRIQEIDYTPRSQFIRNIQNKICELRSTNLAKKNDCLQTCLRSSAYHRAMESTRLQDIFADKKTISLNEYKYLDDRQESPASQTMFANEQNEFVDITCTSCKKTRSPKKLSQSTLRKSVKSKKQVSESSEKLATKSLMQDKRIVRKQNSSCCCINELEKKKLDDDRHVQRHDLPEYCEQREQCVTHNDSFAVKDFMDKEMENLKKFREKNYFETHGSSHTLASSRSSDSLQQYVLNERLFPEPVGKIHKQDLVVTIPPCATTQKKRVHYFPRYIVRQEKSACNTNYKHKRCQSCPLTGHAIDLGILKTRPPLNSLALKYQKKAL